VSGRCAVHPVEPVRRFGDVYRCSACGEITGTVRPTLRLVDLALALEPFDARAQVFEALARDNPILDDQVRPGIIAPPPPWTRRARRALAELLYRWARRIDP
jgi:hypothetical protein